MIVSGASHRGGTLTTMTSYAVIDTIDPAAGTSNNVAPAQFFGLVEILRKSLRRHHVPLRERNELLALLAPMAPDVIEVPSPPMPKRPGP